jgi:hypothetical protein
MSLQAELRAILKKYVDNQQLLNKDAATVKQSIAESSELSDRVKEVAQGLCWFAIRRVGARRTRMLHLLYTGGAVPLSLAKLDARPAKRKSTRRSTNERDLVLLCCRQLIAEQISDYRKSFWSDYFATVDKAVADKVKIPRYPRCPLSGKSLWSNKTHVDHVHPFVKLVEEWAALNSLDFQSIKCKQSRKLKRLSMGVLLDDSWSAFHLDRAELRLTEARANMSKGAKC